MRFPLTLFLILLAAFAVLLPAPAAGEHDIGKVSKKLFVGAYGTRTDGQKETLYYRTNVYEFEVVETPKTGETTLRLLDRSKLQIGPSSRLTLDRMVYDPDKRHGNVSLEFTTGLFRFITGKMANNEGFQLSTPTVLIGVRGTDFVVQVDANGVTRVAVLSGEVEVTPRTGGAPAVVAANQTATITAANADAVLSEGTPVANHPSMRNNSY